MFEVHPIPPLFNEQSHVLISDSFPSVASREQCFFYGHKQNRFRRVCAEIFASPVPETVDEKKTLILSNHLALWDIIASCEIIGSQDSSIKNVTVNSLDIILSNAPITRICVNVQTAYRNYMKYTSPQTGIMPTVLPSTSPANAARSIDRLKEAWQCIRLQ